MTHMLCELWAVCAGIVLERRLKLLTLISHLHILHAGHSRVEGGYVPIGMGLHQPQQLLCGVCGCWTRRSISGKEGIIQILKHVALGPVN